MGRWGGSLQGVLLLCTPKYMECNSKSESKYNGLPSYGDRMVFLHLP